MHLLFTQFPIPGSASYREYGVKTSNHIVSWIMAFQGVENCIICPYAQVNLIDSKNSLLASHPVSCFVGCHSDFKQPVSEDTDATRASSTVCTEPVVLNHKNRWINGAFQGLKRHLLWMRVIHTVEAIQNTAVLLNVRIPIYLYDHRVDKTDLQACPASTILSLDRQTDKTKGEKL